MVYIRNLPYLNLGSSSIPCYSKPKSEHNMAICSCCSVHFQHETHFYRCQKNFKDSSAMTRFSKIESFFTLPLSAVSFQNKWSQKNFLIFEESRISLDSSCYSEFSIKPLCPFSLSLLLLYVHSSSSSASASPSTPSSPNSHHKAHSLVISSERSFSILLLTFAAVLLFAVIAQPAVAVSTPSLVAFSDNFSRGT